MPWLQNPDARSGYGTEKRGLLQRRRPPRARYITNGAMARQLGRLGRQGSTGTSTTLSSVLFSKLFIANELSINEKTKLKKKNLKNLKNINNLEMAVQNYQNWNRHWHASSPWMNSNNSSAPSREKKFKRGVSCGLTARLTKPVWDIFRRFCIWIQIT